MYLDNRVFEIPPFSQGGFHEINTAVDAPIYAVCV